MQSNKYLAAAQPSIQMQQPRMVNFQQSAPQMLKYNQVLAAAKKATPAKETKKSDDKSLIQKIKDNKVKTVILGFAAYKVGEHIYNNMDEDKTPAAKWDNIKWKWTTRQMWF